MGERWGKMGKRWVKNEITGLQKTALMHASAGLASTMQHSAEHVIDHVFASEGGVCVGGPEVGPLPREGGQGPWGAGDDHDGSDHAWLRLSLQPKM